MAFEIRPVRLRGAGVSLSGLSAGKDGAPVLMLHGFPDHSRMWQPLMPALAARHRLVAPDLRGINESDKPSDYGIDALVADVCTLIDDLGGCVALVGHDWGGMLAWTVAARHPERVGQLVIINAPHPVRLAEQIRDDPAQRAASAYVLAMSQAGVEGRLAKNDYAALWAVLAGSIPGLPPEERAASVAAWRQPGALVAALNWYRDLHIERAYAPGGVAAVPDLGTSSGHVQAPTLVLWGERDGSFPLACLDGLSRWVPCLRLERFPELNHWPHLERPAELAQLILDFLTPA